MIECAFRVVPDSGAIVSVKADKSVPKLGGDKIVLNFQKSLGCMRAIVLECQDNASIRPRNKCVPTRVLVFVG